MTAAITLRIPQARPYHGVARLVVGGLAARLELSYEHLEDLQLALAGLLENDGSTPGAEVTIELVVAEGSLELRVGPFEPDRIEAELARRGDDDIGLARLLSTLVEEVAVERDDDGGWVRLRKRIEAVPWEEGNGSA